MRNTGAYTVFPCALVNFNAQMVQGGTPDLSLVSDMILGNSKHQNVDSDIDTQCHAHTRLTTSMYIYSRVFKP